MSDQIKEVLKITAKWMEASANPENADAKLVIERAGFVKEGDSITQVRYTIRAEVILGGVQMPVTRILKPAEPVLIQPDGAPAKS